MQAQHALIKLRHPIIGCHLVIIAKFPFELRHEILIEEIMENVLLKIEVIESILDCIDKGGFEIDMTLVEKDEDMEQEFHCVLAFASCSSHNLAMTFVKRIKETVDLFTTSKN